MRRILSSIGFTLALLCPSIAFAQNPPTSCTTTSQNLWVRDQLNTYYYWYQFLPPSVNPASFNSPEAYLEAVRYRPIDNTFSFITLAASNDAFYSDSQFIGYGFGNQTTATTSACCRSTTTVPRLRPACRAAIASPASTARACQSMVAAGTIGGAFGAADIGVVTTIDWDTPGGAAPIGAHGQAACHHSHGVADARGRRRRPQGRLPVLPQLRAAFDGGADRRVCGAEDRGATELVLDLRYNGGGLVDVAVHLASLIGGTRTNGQVMLNYVHNDKIGPTLNKTTRFTNPEQALNLQRLVVITTRGSASASELVINSLRPFIPVTIIGDTTYGKPVGQYGLRFCDKVLYPVAFSIKNANLEGDFFDGLAGDCAAGDDYTHQLGDTAEASLAEALTFIRTGACSPRAAAREARALRAPQFIFRPTGWASILNACSSVARTS